MNFSLDVLNPLVRGNDMSREHARDALAEILSGRVEGLLIASFLTAVTAKGETAEEMTGFVDAMMAAATTIKVPDDCIDIVGTGGDQLHTVNISTMAALTIAGAGVAVAKHGNRAASSSTGAADVLEALGVRLDASPEIVSACIAEARIGFLFAPAFHHALGYLVPIRRGLNFRTVFNVLGPLANPASVRRSVIGVAQRDLLEKMAYVLTQRDMAHAMLVNADDGLDELSLGAPSTLHHVQGTTQWEERIDAGDLLGRRYSVSDIRGGDAEANARAVRNYLEGRRDAVFDVACANAALGLMVAGAATDFIDGFEKATHSVLTGAAATALEKLVATSQG